MREEGEGGGGGRDKEEEEVRERGGGGHADEGGLIWLKLSRKSVIKLSEMTDTVIH